MPRRRLLASTLVVVTALLVLSGSAAVVFYPKAVSTRNVPRTVLRASFDADVRNTVYAWDASDPRPEPQRMQALFEFMYQGYDSSAWIPQSLFDGNRITNAVIGDQEMIIRDRIGLVLWSENKVARAYGMARNPDPMKPLSWTVNCVACHTAEVDGVAYLGAGAKVLDEKMLADTVRLVTGSRGRQMLADDGDDHRLASHAHDVMKRHHHDRIDPLTRGRSTAFPASHVEMYMRVHDGVMPDNAAVGRGDVKAPPLWHTAAKRPFARWYCDGSFHSDLPLMASSMELELDNSFEKLVTSVLPTIKSDFQAVIQYLRSPAYPHAIDRALAAKGHDLFYSRAIGCSGCHGQYDGKGNIKWTGLHVDVGTDPGRNEVVSEGFIAAFNSSPLAREGRLKKSEGYAATPLTGVWVNYPYLHNGSVPTLHHLLGPVSERPRVFSVMAARRFDPERVGQRLDPEGASGPRSENDRDWFHADREGCGNQGHDFWSRIKTDENRRALIEYLKTL